MLCLHVHVLRFGYVRVRTMRSPQLLGSIKPAEILSIYGPPRRSIGLLVEGMNRACGTGCRVALRVMNDLSVSLYSWCFSELKGNHSGIVDFRCLL